jgi:preprotein translocase subunit SecE
MAAELEVKRESWIDATRAYLGDIRSEMKRVTWPNRDQVQSTTVVVIFAVFLFAAYFEIVDKVINASVVKLYGILSK